MLYLLIATVFSASLALIFRYSEPRGISRYGVTAVNYLTAAIVSLGVGLAQHRETFAIQPLDAFRAEAAAVFSGSGTFSDAAGFWWAIVLGVPTGVLFCSSFLLYQYSVKRYGAGIPGMFAKLGILVPTFISLLVWRELPEGLQWLGIGLTVMAIVASQLGGIRSGTGSSGKLLLLLTLMISNGLAEFSGKLLQAYAPAELRAIFLLTVFSVAFLEAVIINIVKREVPGKRELAVGLAVGIPNLFSAYFLIMALQTVPAALAYPIFSAGSVVLIALGAWAIFREHLGRYDIGAIALTSAGLAFIA